MLTTDYRSRAKESVILCLVEPVVIQIKIVIKRGSWRYRCPAPPEHLTGFLLLSVILTERQGKGMTIRSLPTAFSNEVVVQAHNNVVVMIGADIEAPWR